MSIILTYLKLRRGSSVARASFNPSKSWQEINKCLMPALLLSDDDFFCNGFNIFISFNFFSRIFKVADIFLLPLHLLKLSALKSYLDKLRRKFVAENFVGIFN